MLVHLPSGQATSGKETVTALGWSQLHRLYGIADASTQEIIDLAMEELSEWENGFLGGFPMAQSHDGLKISICKA